MRTYFRKWTACVLAAAMACSGSVTPAYAELVSARTDSDSVHREHGPECFREETNCIHIHTADCFLQETEEDTIAGATPSDAADKTVLNVCSHVCSQESGCIKKVLDCPYENEAEDTDVPVKSEEDTRKGTPSEADEPDIKKPSGTNAKEDVQVSAWCFAQEPDGLPLVEQGQKTAVVISPDEDGLPSFEELTEHLPSEILAVTDEAYSDSDIDLYEIEKNRVDTTSIAVTGWECKEYKAANEDGTYVFKALTEEGYEFTRKPRLLAIVQANNIAECTVTVTDGSISPSQTTYASGSTVTLTAKDKSSEKLCFDHWNITEGDGVLEDAQKATTELTVNSSLSVEAVYVQGYTLTVNNGSGSGLYKEGEAVSITASLPTGAEFAAWTLESGDGSFDDSYSAATRFTMKSKDAVIKAQYRGMGLTGDFAVSGGAFGTDYTYSNGCLTFTGSGSYDVSMKEGVTSTGNHIQIKGGTPEITLHNVRIGSDSAFEILDNARTTLILDGGNFLYSNTSNGLSVSGGSTLEITSIQGDGSSAGALTAETAQTTGSNNFGRSGICYKNITIKGGTINAKGGYGAAGIGADPEYQKDNGCSLTIEGGTVIATGGWGGAGIGGAYQSDGQRSENEIIINGGNVTATGGQGAAGIGGGYKSDSDNLITITAGKVRATGGAWSSGETPVSGIGLGVGNGSAILDISNKATIKHGRRSATETVSAADINNNTVKAERYVLVEFASGAGAESSISIAPKTASLFPGGTQQFTSTLENASDPTVDWSVSGNVSTKTVISSSGLLTVGADETAAELTVTASLRAYQKSVSAQVKLTPLTTALSVDKKEITVDDTVTASLTVPGTSDGLVRFYLDGVPVSGPLTPENGKAQFEIGKSLLTAGTHSISAQFFGTGFRAESDIVTVKVNKHIPKISSWPTTSRDITYGQELNMAGCQGGSGNIPGTFDWVDGSLKPDVGTGSYEVIFTPNPEYCDRYSTIFGTIKATVLPATPQVKINPSASVLYGQTLKDGVITGGEAINPDNNQSVAGTWSWKQPQTMVEPGKAYTAVFTPEDTKRYTGSATADITVSVNAAAPQISLTLDKTSQVAGKPVSVFAAITNSYSAAITDVPSATFYYQVGSGSEIPVTGSSFTIPSGTGVGTVITVIAKTNAVPNKYTAARGTTTVTVVDRLFVSDQVSVSIQDVTYGEAPAPVGQFSGTVDGTESWTYTYSDDNGHSWSETAPTAVGTYLVKAVYNDESQTGESTKTWNILPKKLTIATASLAEKTYDGSTAVDVVSVGFDGLISGENLVTDDYMAAAEFADANAGSGKTAFVTVTLKETETAKNYELADGGVYTLTEQTIKKTEAPAAIMLSCSYSYGLTGEQSIIITGLPADCGEVSGGNAEVTSDESDILADLVSLSGRELTFSLNQNTQAQTGASAVITINGLNMTNYEAAQVQVTITLTEKQDQPSVACDLTFRLNADGKTYTAVIGAIDGAEYSFDGVTWSDSNEKTDCLPDTLYTGCIRLKETSAANAGPVSEASARTPKIEEKPPVVIPDNSGSGDGGSNSDSGSDSDGDSSNSSISSGSRYSDHTFSPSFGTLYQDPRKGYMSPRRGIVTGIANRMTNDGYSHWMRDEKGWWLRYSDGTYAAGTLVQIAADSRPEIDGGLVQYQWEMVDGRWYAFDEAGYLKIGLFYDAGYGGYFFQNEDTGMQTGWIFLNGNWYYFNPVSDSTKGIMLHGRKTPDGYYVKEDGTWDGKPQEQN